MPNKKSAEKRLRQSEKARIVNRAVRSEIRTSLKKVRGAQSKDEALKELPNLFSLLDKAAQKGQANMKANTASNYKRKAYLVVSKLSA